MSPSLRAGNGMYLVEDQRLDATEDLAGLRGQHQEEGLRRRDQDVRRVPEHPLPLLLRRVAGAHRDGQLRAQPGKRAPEVALDVVVERLQRRDVEQPEPSTGLRGQLVDSVE